MISDCDVDQGDFRGALLHAARATELMPSSADNQLAYADALRDSGQLDEAIMHYGMSLAIWRDRANVWNRLGVTCYMKGDLRDAVRCFLQVIHLKPGWAAGYRNLGLAQLSDEDFAGAAASYRKALVLEPSDTFTRQQLGVALSHLGKDQR